MEGQRSFMRKFLSSANCYKFWKWCACAHALLVGTYLHERASGFSMEHILGGAGGGILLPRRCLRKNDPGTVTCREKQDAASSKIKGKFKPQH